MSLPNFELIPDRPYRKIFTAVDWRMKDCHGKILNPIITYPIDYSVIEEISRLLFSNFSQNGKNWAVSATEFFYFSAHMINIKCQSSLGKILITPMQVRSDITDAGGRSL